MTHKNEEFVVELYRRLSRDGVECFFDRESIAWGANWVVELERGIDEADDIVLVVTPDFCTSEWTRLERTSAMADDPAGIEKRMRPLLLEPCDDLPRFLKPLHFIDVSTQGKFEEAYPKICSALGGILVKESLDVDRSTLPPVSPLPERHRMPYRSLGLRFVGGVRDLWDIHDILRQRETAVVEGVGIVAGTGGIGKTQLAVEYVHRFGSHYPGGVFWIDADYGLSAMIAQILQSADIPVDSKLEIRDQLIQLWKEFHRFHQRVLMILDNFPENEPLQPWLPTSSYVRTLVTTRRRDLDHPNISLRFMTIQEGMALLNSGVRKFGQEAGLIVEALGGLPLALELTRKFLNLRVDLTIQRLLEEINRTRRILVGVSYSSLAA